MRPTSRPSIVTSSAASGTVFSRRQVLAGAAAAATWAGSVRSARAAAAPTRLIVFPLLNGAQPNHFWPSPGNLAAMSLVTEPLRAYQRQLTFVRGINVAGSMNHMAVRSIFTGAPIADYLSPDPAVKSVDQVMADHAAGSTRLRSLHLGVIPADSIQLYQMYGRSTFFFNPRPVDYEANPVSAFDRTFKNFSGPARPGMSSPAPAMPGPTPTPAPTPSAPLNLDSDVLAIAEAELGELSTRVGSAEAQRGKLDQHRQALRSLRAAVSVPPAGPPTGMPMPGPTPAPTPKPAPDPMTPPAGPAPACNASAIASVEKLRSALQGKDAAAYRHEFFSDIFDAQIDIAARAIVCGLTRVATIQAGSADGNVTDPVGPGYPHHNTSHGNQEVFARCQQWYAGKLARLLKALDVADPLDPTGKTVLHNSVVLVMSECLPLGHDSNSVPVLLAGNAGGALKAGAFVDLKGANNKQLMASVLHACGAGAAHFGGGLSELRA